MSESECVLEAKTRLGTKPLAGLLLFFFATAAVAQAPASGDERRGREKPASARGALIVDHGGYPELRVDGAPFFVHSAAFFYYRIPRDLWERALERHRELGINTLDLYIPWNWHEPREGQLDFDGHTNPRRDLRGLLRLITEKGFKLIARPGPVILNEWRHGGYPEWLLERPEYKMDAVDRLEGRYPPLSNLNARDAEGAAKGWLDNPTHLAYARRWLAAVARELAPYRSQHVVRVKVRREKQGEPAEKEISGPLLFVQLDDDMAIGRVNNAGPAFWRYMDELRRMLEAGGLDAPCYINPTDMRVSAAGAGLERPIGAMGQWYLQPPPSGAEPGERKLTAQDASTIEFFVEELKTQPAFPPILIEYQAGWYTPGDDARPLESPPANTLVSSRLLLAYGLHGLNYFPAQDTLFPAGYETPWTNRDYRWDAALDLNGNRQPRARAVARNAQILETWGEFLAASHKRADFGVVYPPGAYPQHSLAPEDIWRVSATVMQLERVAQLAGLASELLDPQYQPVEQFLRHTLVLLPVFDPAQPKFLLSESAQRVLVEYVRRGGTLVYFPIRPAGKVFQELWKTSPVIPAPAPASTAAIPQGSIAAHWTFGRGRVVESSKDFYSWVPLAESFADNRARFEATWATETLREFLKQAGVRPAVKRALAAPGAGGLVATQLVSNAGTQALGLRGGGRGLVSVTNLSDDEVAEETFEVLSPRASARGTGDGYIRMGVWVPPRESLLLPVGFPLCSAALPNEKCDDEVVAAGAELLRAERDGKTLELTFYTPARAAVLLKLERQPRHLMLEGMRPQATWIPEQRELEISLLRGASPEFRRTLKIELPYTPHVPEKSTRRKNGRHDFDSSVTDAVRLPLAEDTSLLSDPPLVVVDQDRNGQLILQARNYNREGRSIEAKITGPVLGSGRMALPADEMRQEKINLRAAKESEPSSNGTRVPLDGLLHGELEVRSGRERLSSPILFVVVRKEGVTPYQLDFDRDGRNEWVLENTVLRLIVSPEAGGRAIALVEKASAANLTTTVGALRDHFAYASQPLGTRPERARGRYGLFNRAYRAEWVQEEKNTALRLSYAAPDVYPAGAEIEKTVRLTGRDSVEVDYQVRLEAPGLSAPQEASEVHASTQNRNLGAASPTQPQAFVAVNSVPVLRRENRSSRFCWQIPPAAAPEGKKDSRAVARDGGAVPAPTSTDHPAAEIHCELFVPGRGKVEVPESLTRVEVRTPERPGLALEWNAGKLMIEMKNFSALLKLQFPPLAPGGEAGQYQVRYHVLAAE